MDGYVMGGCVSLLFLKKKLQKRKINDQGGICVRRDVTKGRSCDHSRWSVMVVVGGGQKRAILAWRNYWTAPQINWPVPMWIPALDWNGLKTKRFSLKAESYSKLQKENHYAK